MRQWPPGSERRTLSKIEPGTEVLRGAQWFKLDRWSRSEKAGLYFVWWAGQDKPDTFQDEPEMTVWLLTQPC